MTFREFVAEAMTSTADVANFQRICIPLVRRNWVNDGKSVEEDDGKRRRRRKVHFKQPQVED